MSSNLDLLEFLQSFHPLSEEVKAGLNSILKKDTYKKKSFLLKEGQVSNKIYFIEKGLVRIYYIKDDVETCSGLICEQGVMISVKSFFDRVPSEEFIQVLEELTAYYITHDELEMLYRDFPEFNIIGRKLITAYYVQSEERNYLLRRQTAQENSGISRIISATSPSASREKTSHPILASPSRP